MPGFIIAVSSAYATFLRWAKLYELRRTDLERPSNVRADYRVPQKSADSFESASRSQQDSQTQSESEANSP